MPKSKEKQGNDKISNAKRKQKFPSKSTSSKKRKYEAEKVLFYGFECVHCPQDKASDSEKEKENKYLQRLILCRKTTYDSTNKGHSLWVNYKAVHCRHFHKSKSSIPTVRVKDGKIVTEESGGSKLSKANLLEYELTRKQYKDRNVLNSKRKAILEGEHFS